MAATSPVEEAERLLRRVAAFRSIGIDENDARQLAKSDVNFAEVMALVRKGCPLELLARILT